MDTSRLSTRTARAATSATGRPATGGRTRRIGQWLALRDHRYIGNRALTLLRRYGATPSRAEQRVLACVELLARYDCRPTFPTPGQVVRRNGAFCRRLQQLGAELAIHGYHHLDFRALSTDEARRQFARAAAAYDRHGITFDGFRCPYLSYTARLDEALPDGRCRYSSNRAIWWDVAPPENAAASTGGRSVFEGLSRFYRADPARAHASVPRPSGGLIEIPVCLPDDLQVLDGLRLGARGLERAWLGILDHTHRRGELFDLMFHPESFDQCGPALEAVLAAARALRPRVWVAQLRDVDRWWREKAGFRVHRYRDGRSLRLVFRCTDRATLLARHLDAGTAAPVWHGAYRVVPDRTLRVPADAWPFIGVAPDAPPEVVAFLRDQGYIVETGPDALACAMFLDRTALGDLRDPVALIDRIETSPAPLVRFWRWPRGARSALCVTGDLDALSLTDYALRLFAA